MSNRKVNVFVKSSVRFVVCHKVHGSATNDVSDVVAGRVAHGEESMESEADCVWEKVLQRIRFRNE